MARRITNTLLLVCSNVGICNTEIYTDPLQLTAHFTSISYLLIYSTELHIALDHTAPLQHSNTLLTQRSTTQQHTAPLQHSDTQLTQRVDLTCSDTMIERSWTQTNKHSTEFQRHNLFYSLPSLVIYTQFSATDNINCAR